VRDLIRDARRRGAAVFLNSHLLGEVEATCDRVAFVQSGRIVHTLSLEAEASGIDVELRAGGLDASALQALSALGPVTVANGHVAAGPSTIRLRVADETTLPRIARVLVERGAELYELKAARKSLETWFVEVMGDEQRPG
jgi:ABC-2 type transport system ATP-binding protein